MLFSAFLFSAFSAFAQNDSLKSNASIFDQTQELIPVTIQGIRVGEKAPYAVSNLKEKEIRENNTGQDIPYLLNQMPSVIINSDAGAGVGYTGIRIRGTDAARINFTINGVPINDPEFFGSGAG